MAESFKQSVVDIVCGSIGGMAGKLIEYPFDTVKVRLQTQADVKPPQFRGPLDCFRQTFQHEGFFGFYRGLSPPLFGAMAENATLFLTYNRAQDFFKSSKLFLTSSGDLCLTGLVVAGGISGACTSYVLTPIELVKCKLQVQNVGFYTPGTTNFPSTSSPLKRQPHTTPAAAIHTSTKFTQPGPLELVKQIYRAQGLPGFWRGQMGTFLRETGGSAAWFGTYEYVSSFLKKRRLLTNQSPISDRDLMMSGACAGMAYNLVLFPADSIKSRMQTDSISDSRASRGFWEVGKEMWKWGGVRVFYRGCLITVLRAAPASAVIFWTYESLKKMTVTG